MCLKHFRIMQLYCIMFDNFKYNKLCFLFYFLVFSLKVCHAAAKSKGHFKETMDLLTLKLKLFRRIKKLDFYVWTSGKIRLNRPSSVALIASLCYLFKRAFSYTHALKPSASTGELIDWGKQKTTKQDSKCIALIQTNTHVCTSRSLTSSFLPMMHLCFCLLNALQIVWSPEVIYYHCVLLFLSFFSFSFFNSNLYD